MVFKTLIFIKTEIFYHPNTKIKQNAKYLSAIVWILNVPKSPCIKGLISRVALLGGWAYGRSLGHWHMPVRGTVGY